MMGSVSHVPRPKINTSASSALDFITGKSSVSPVQIYWTQAFAKSAEDISS